MKKLSELLHLKLVTEDKKTLGRVVDFRSSGEPEHGDSRSERAVDEIVYARFGLLERLGLRKAKEKTISLNSALTFKDRKIIVADSGAR